MMKKIFFLFLFLLFFVNTVFAKEPVLRVLIKDFSPDISISSSAEFIFYTNPHKPRTFKAGNINIKATEEYFKIEINGEAFLEFTDVVYFKARADNSLMMDNKNYSGVLEIKRRKNLIRVINRIGLESYLSGVLPRELKTSYMEALKSQAIASRTYAYAKIFKSRKNDYDIRSDSYHQVYEGQDEKDELIEKAIKETSGMVLYYKNKLAEYVCYHSTCGGSTENNENVFLTEPIPYLRAISCNNIELIKFLKESGKKEYESVIKKIPENKSALCEDSGCYKWEVKLIKKELENDFPENFRKTLGKLMNIVPLKFGTSGRVVELNFAGDKKDYLVLGDNIRRILKFKENGKERWLYSTFFKIKEPNGSEIILNGGGWGHGVGMCQFGALRMAKLGLSFEDILKYYYRGCEVRKAY